jgi:predicted metal-dependent peptidase
MRNASPLNPAAAALDRIRAARARLVLAQPFFGLLAMRLELTDATGRPEIRTMATDGRRLFYCPAFVLGLSEAELEGVLVHEVLHCAYRHFARRGERPRDQFNVAADYAINPDVIAAGFRLPAGVLIDPAFKGRTTEEIFDSLFGPRAAPPSPPAPAPDQDQDQDQDGPEGHQDGADGSEGDEDGEDQDADQDGADGADGDQGDQDRDGDGDASEDGADGSGDEDGDEGEDGDGSGSGDADEDGEGGEADGSGDADGADQDEPGRGSGRGRGRGARADQDGADQDQDGGDQDGGDQDGEPEDGGELDPAGCGGILDEEPDPDQDGSDADPERLSRDWSIWTRQAVAAQKRHNAGTLPGYLQRVVNDLNTPRVDWREILRRFISQSMVKDYSWSRPSKRFPGADFVLPGLVSDSLSELVLVLDTSGSVFSFLPLLQQFVAEIRAAIEDGTADRITVLHVDTAVRAVQVFERGDVVDVGRPVGGGGTAFAPAFRWIEDNAANASAVVYFTDLECWDYGPAPSAPVLWAAYGPPESVERHGSRVPFGEVIRIS